MNKASKRRATPLSTSAGSPRPGRRNGSGPGGRALAGGRDVPQGDHAGRGAQAGGSVADGRHEIPALRQWPARLARAGGHRPRLCRRRDAPLVLRFPRPDAAFFRKAERHRGRGVPAMADWVTVSRGQPGFLFEAEVALPRHDEVDREVRRDLAGDCRPRSSPIATTYDAGKEPAGWRLPGFDDTAWPACREVKDVWEPLVASEIPPLMEARYPVLRIEGLPSRTSSPGRQFSRGVRPGAQRLSDLEGQGRQRGADDDRGATCRPR